MRCSFRGTAGDAKQKTVEILITIRSNMIKTPINKDRNFFEDSILLCHLPRARLRHTYLLAININNSYSNRIHPKLMYPIMPLITLSFYWKNANRTVSNLSDTYAIANWRIGINLEKLGSCGRLIFFIVCI